MNKLSLSLLLAAALALAACSPSGGPGADKTPEGGHAGDHGHGPGNIAVTHYMDATELFVEFPKLVKGEEAAFAAHLTHLAPAGFQAVAEGRLTVLLSGGGLPEERAHAGVSATPGIFRPILRPQHAGKRRLAFHLALGERTVTHDLGEVEVYADRKAAEAAAEEDGAEGIGFTKEQQWKIPFAHQVVTERVLRESVAATATLRPRAGGEAIIAAPGAGLLRPGPGGFPQIGMTVQAGQVLAYLVPRLGGEIDAATLQLAAERARIEAGQARQERERLEGLLQLEAVPEKRVIEARNRERLAAAELSAAQRRLATYAGGSGGIALKAPVAGTVVAVGAGAGAAVVDGQTLIHVADLGRLWLEARIPESELGRITRPAGAFFRLDGEQAARVLEVGKNSRLVAFGGLVDKDSRTVPAIFELSNADGRLRAGMNLRVGVFTGRTEKALAVPASALVDDHGQPVVFVQKEGETFERRVVILGTRDGDWVAVRSGLAAGERVVTLGAYQVRLAATAPAALGHGHAH